MWKETTFTEIAKTAGKPHYREQNIKRRKG